MTGRNCYAIRHDMTHLLPMVVVGVLIAEVVKFVVKTAWQVATEENRPLEGFGVIAAIIVICVVVAL